MAMSYKSMPQTAGLPAPCHDHMTSSYDQRRVGRNSSYDQRRVEPLSLPRPCSDAADDATAYDVSCW